MGYAALTWIDRYVGALPEYVKAYRQMINTPNKPMVYIAYEIEHGKLSTKPVLHAIKEETHQSRGEEDILACSAKAEIVKGNYKLQNPEKQLTFIFEPNYLEQYACHVKCFAYTQEALGARENIPTIKKTIEVKKRALEALRREKKIREINQIKKKLSQCDLAIDNLGMPTSPRGAKQARQRESVVFVVSSLP